MLKENCSQKYKENDKSHLMLDDFQTFYNESQNDSSSNPLILDNYDDEKTIVYSPVEKENFIKTENIYQNKKNIIINETSKSIINESLSFRFINSNNIYANPQDSISSNKNDFNQYRKEEENCNNKESNIKNYGNKEIFRKDKSKKETHNNNEKINVLFDFPFKFITKKYFVGPDGKKKRVKVKKKRKFKPDDIRKRIKSKFHKTLKDIINENLQKAGSKQLFDFLPQCFTSNI